MKSLFLADIKSAATNRLPGYEQEILKRGKKLGDTVQLSDSDYEYISKNFKLDAKIEKQVDSISKKEESIEFSTSKNNQQKIEFKKISTFEEEKENNESTTKI
jgi:ribosomal protein S1